MVDTVTGLPLAWEVETASQGEVPIVPSLLDTLAARGIRPIVPLRETSCVLAGKHLPRKCEHDTWTYAGSDARRGASKWRCPTGQCSPAPGG